MPLIMAGRNFNSRPHEEVDRRSRIRSGATNISTHDLTKRSTGIDTSHNIWGWNFNSRPHEEVDWDPTEEDIDIWDFNSRPHEEVDLKKER